jgi:hypothetical protein
MSHLLFSDVFLFPFLGPIAGIGLLLPFIVTWRRPCHVDAKCKVQLPSCKSVAIIHATLYHVDAWKRLSVDLHGILTQDQSALLNSRLDMLMEFFAVASVVGERTMPFAV